MLKNKQFKMNTMGAFNKFFTAIIILIPFFVLSQKEYFPTNSGVKVVNEPYKAFVNATIVINSEKTIEKLSFQARLTLALSLMGSVMAVMSIFKMVVEKAIDTYYLSHKEVPQDVQRRHVVLSESMITRGGSRRMSSFVKTKGSLRPHTMTNPLYVPRKNEDIDGDVELQNVVSRSRSSFKTYASMRKMVQELQMEMKEQQMEMKEQLKWNQQRDVDMKEQLKRNQQEIQELKGKIKCN